MPAAAVIPAPIAYINVVAVKKLVVGFQCGLTGLPMGMHWPSRVSSRRPRLLLTEAGGGKRDFYFEEIRVFKAGQLVFVCVSMG